MKRNVLIALLIIGAMGGFVYQITSKQHRSASETKGSISVNPGVFQISGNVTQVNQKNSTFTIFNEASGWPVFSVNEKTIFFKKGKNIQFSNVGSGDFVAVTYETIRGRNIAKSVTFTAQPIHKKDR